MRPLVDFAIPVRLDADDMAAAERGAKRWLWEADRQNQISLASQLAASRIDNREKALAVDMEGAAGEVAVAKLFGIPWDANVGGDRPRPDVAYCDVRASRHLSGHLLIYAKDEPNRPHILVVGTAPTLWVVGWIYGFDAKVRRWWRPSSAGGAYWIPQPELLPWPVPVERFRYERKEAA